MSDIGGENQVGVGDIQSWFKARGFTLVLQEERGRHWVDLVSIATGKVLAPRYGLGDDDLGAAIRARTRYEQEQ